MMHKFSLFTTELPFAKVLRITVTASLKCICADFSTQTLKLSQVTKGITTWKMKPPAKQGSSNRSSLPT